MDIEFIEEQHRDNIFKIMELCGIDMAEAYELYISHGNNVENAVQAKFNPAPSNSINPNLYNQIPAQNYSNQYDKPPVNNYNKGHHNEEDQYEKYKNFLEAGNLRFNQRYTVRHEQGLISGMWNKLVKGPSESTFKKKLEEYTKRKSNLKFGVGTLSESLESIYKSKFPLVLHVLNFNAQLKNQIAPVYADQHLTQVLNTQFENYGLDSNDYAMQEFMHEYINLKSQTNSLIVFRISITDEIVAVANIPLHGSPQEIKKKLKQIKSNCINLEMEELHLEKRYKQQINGNFDYKKPMSVNDQRKLKEDRQIRRKQEEEFFAAMKPKEQTEKQQQSTTYQNNYNSNEQKSESKPVPKKPTLEEILKKRQKIRASLKKYESGPDLIMIKLRQPSSQSIKIQVHKNQTAQYLYDLVYSHQTEDLGFEKQLERQFDIIEPYDKINLSDKKNQKLGTIFEGQDMLQLIVNQKIE